MSNYRLIYKCRNCGCVYEVSSFVEENKYIVDLSNFENRQHECPDVDEDIFVGISDLIAIKNYQDQKQVILRGTII